MNILKIEIKRAFTSKKFYIALLIGLGIAIVQSVTGIRQELEDQRICELYKLYEKDRFTQSSSLYTWMFGNMVNVEQYIFFIIFPFIATLPHASSFFEDKKNGMYRVMVLKCGKMKYFISKYIAVFLSGGAAILIPIVFNLLTTMMFIPTVKPETTSGIYAVWSKTMIGDMFYSRPALYLTIFIITDVLAAGFFATISIIVSYLTEYKFVVEMAPLFIYIFLFSFLGLFDACDSQLNYALNPAFSDSDGVKIFVQIAVVAIITAVFCLIKGRTDEVV